MADYECVGKTHGRALPVNKWRVTIGDYRPPPPPPPKPKAAAKDAPSGGVESMAGLGRSELAGRGASPPRRFFVRFFGVLVALAPSVSGRGYASPRSPSACEVHAPHPRSDWEWGCLHLFRDRLRRRLDAEVRTSGVTHMPFECRSRIAWASRSEHALDHIGRSRVAEHVSA